jgi:glutathione peroxidase
MSPRHCLFVLIAAACGTNSTPAAQPAPAPEPVVEAEPPVEVEAPTQGRYAMLYDIEISTLSDQPTKLGEYRGKAILAVNVASKCGLTPQYTQLEELQKKYADKGFTVLGFPCNQFGGQEPGSPEEIQTFCSTNYGVTFPLTEKIDVNGDGRHPVYQVLTDVADADGNAGDIQWNFEKFVISADGGTITRFRPQTKPDDPKVIAAIEAALPE